MDKYISHISPICLPYVSQAQLIKDMDKLYSAGSRIATEMGGKVRIAKVNIDDNPNAPSRYGVRGIPTLLIFKDGQLVDRKVGADSKRGIESWIAGAI